MNNFKTFIIWFLSVCSSLYIGIGFSLIECSYAQQSDDTLSEKRYIARNGRFSIIAPADWQIREYPDDSRGRVEFVAQETNVSIIVMASVKNFSSIEELFRGNSEIAQDLKARFGIDVDIQKTTFLNKPAIKRSFVMQGIKILGIEFMEGNVRHSRQYSAPSELYAKYFPIAMKVMETYESIPIEVSNESVEQDRSARKSQLSKQAQVASEGGDLDFALKLVEEGLSMDPQDQELLTVREKIIGKQAQTYKSQGTAYLERRKYNEAIEAFTKAISLTPNDIQLYLWRGVIYRKKGQSKEAIEDFNKAIQLDANAVDAFVERGVFYLELGQYGKAIQDFNKVINLKPDQRVLSVAYNNRGFAYRKIGNIKKAIDDYTKAIEADPQNGEAYNNRGSLYFSEDIEKAVADYEKACDLGSDKGCRNLQRVKKQLQK
jgi:tetratricopeptide (TPR) repeat protein